MNADEIRDIDFGEMPMARLREYETEYERFARILVGIHAQLKRIAESLEGSKDPVLVETEPK